MLVILNSLRKAINGIYSIDNVQKVINLEQSWST